MNIEKADLKDIPRLCEILAELFSQELEFIPNNTLQAKALRTIIESETLGDVFIVEIDENIVAMVNLLYTYSTALGAPVAILEDMIVDKAYRGQKIATKLLEYIQNYLKENGFKRLTLLTDSDNEKAHSLYRKNGFESSTMIPFRTLL